MAVGAEFVQGVVHCVKQHLVVDVLPFSKHALVFYERLALLGF